MKKIFKKSMAVFMAVLMLLSVVAVSAFAATYTVTFKPGNFGKGESPAPIVVDGKRQITLPGACYTRDGYVQTGWSTVASGSRKVADINGTYNVTKSLSLYPYWEAKKIQVTFAPGDYGVGEAQTVEVTVNKTTVAPDAIFTREGYIMLGWSSVNGGEVEFGLKASTPTITDDITFYPVWQICDYSIEVDKTSANFGNVCVDYALPSAAQVTIKNVGNTTLEYTLPVSAAYNLTVVSGSLSLDVGKSLTISIQPKSGLAAADYKEDIVFDCVYDVSDVTFNAFFTVNEHSYDKYVSNGDATYYHDGTKTAQCGNGCGNVDIIIDEGSMKVYDAANNTVEGLLKEYIYHKTVRVTAYGSGTDNVQADGTIAEGTKRYRPVSWYVNDEFNGEFKDGNYDINFVHTSFGDYTLKVKYVEEVYTCDNHTGPHYFCEECGELTGAKCEFCGADTFQLVCDICNDPTCGNVLFEEDSEKTFDWVATGEEDEKSFDYYVGPSAKEEQEVIRPNTIVSIIFGLFAKLFGLIFGNN